jgi:hypothetical protein
MRITVLAADCADPGTEASSPLITAQTSSANLTLHPKARRTDRVEPGAREFAALKGVIERFRKAAHRNKQTPS